MTSLHIIALRAGAGGPEPLEPLHVRFYQMLAKETFNEEITIPANSPNLTVPLNVDDLNDHSTTLFPTILDRWIPANSAPQVVIVDFHATSNVNVRGVVNLRLGSAIDIMIRQDQAAEHPCLKGVILMLMDIPTEGEVVLKLLRPHIDACKVFIYSQNGEKIPSTSHVSKETYLLGLADLHGDPIDLLDLKMLRHRGHYMRKVGNDIDECVSLYFEGSLCGPELRTLLGRWIRKYLLEDKDKKILLYDEAYSQWVQGPLIREAVENNFVNCYEYKTIKNDGAFSDRIRRASLIAVVLPLTDSGRTVLEIATRIREINSSVELRFLSILSTAGSLERHGIRKLALGDSTIEMDYFLKVQQKRFRKGSNMPCPMCALNIRPTLEGTLDTVMLSAYDFWDMTFEFGLKDEDFVPSYRNSLGKIPNFNDMIVKNGAWLAYKISKVFEFESIGDPAKLTIVCRDQTTSRLLTDFLRVAMGTSIVLIPDSVFAELNNPHDIDDLRTKWEFGSELWYLQLAGTFNRDIVILDEFTVTDKTRETLINLVKYVKKNVVAAFSFVNFIPEKNGNSSRLPSLSLYSWQFVYPENEEREVANVLKTRPR